MGHIQIGETYSPQIRPGDADALLGFELAEATRRGVTYLKDGGLAIVNRKKIPPVEVVSGVRKYPAEEELLGLLRRVAGKLIVLDATSLAEEAGDPIAANVVMLGALAASGVLPYDESEVVEVLKTSIPPRFIELNLRSFQSGAKALREST